MSGPARLDELSAGYRGYVLRLDEIAGGYLARIYTDLSANADFVVSGPTAFLALEQAFDLVDEVLSTNAAPIAA
jgi:hypothetical protein